VVEIADDEFIAKEEAELFIWSNELGGFKPVVEETVEARLVQTGQHTCQLATNHIHMKLNQ
jgi:hypothetical protein